VTALANNFFDSSTKNYSPSKSKEASHHGRLDEDPESRIARREECFEIWSR
jgi:hypothetical protein